MSMPSILTRSFVLIFCCLVLSPPSAAQVACTTGAGTSLSFDGNDWVRVIGVAPGVLDGFADFTLEGWFKGPPPTGFGATLLSSWGAGGSPYTVRISASGSVTVFVPGAAAMVSSVSVADNTWHHIAFGRIGAACTIYVDGNVVGSGTTAASLPASTLDLAIGVQIAGTIPNPLTFSLASLDEIRIWNVGRTQAEINSTRLSALNGNEPGLVGLWALDAGAGQTVPNTAVATAAQGLDGVRGFDGAAASDDPTWSNTVFPPLAYCALGTGQANSLLGSLRVNGVGSNGFKGIHAVAVPTSGPTANRVTFTWGGPPNAPLFLVVGTPAVNTAFLPCSGSLDLSLAGLVVAGEYFSSPFPLSLLFILDGNGFAETSFTVPTAILGAPWISLQGGVFNPACSPVPYVFTAAFTIS